MAVYMFPAGYTSPASTHETINVAVEAAHAFIARSGALDGWTCEVHDDRTASCDDDGTWYTTTPIVVLQD